MKSFLTYIFVPSIVSMLFICASSIQTTTSHVFKYKAWDGKTVQAAVILSPGKSGEHEDHSSNYTFEHTPEGGVAHSENFIKYVTWNGHKWMASIIDGQFNHFKTDEGYHANKIDHKSYIIHFVDSKDTHWQAKIIGQNKNYVSFEITKM